MCLSELKKKKKKKKVSYLICMCFVCSYLSMFHMERRSRNMLIIIIIIKAGLLVPACWTNGHRCKNLIDVMTSRYLAGKKR